MRAPVGALGGEERWGAFSESAEGGAAGSEIGALPGGRRGRCGPRGLDPYREVGGPGGPRRRVRVGDAGSGDAGLQGDVAGWWCAVGPVPSPGGLRLWNPVLGGFKQRLKIRQGCPPETPSRLPHQPFRR